MPAIVIAGYIAADSLSDRPPLPIAVAAGVSVSAPVEWEFVNRVEPQPDGTEGVVLTRGAGTLILLTSPAATGQVLADLSAELTAGGMMSIGDTAPVDVREGQPAERFAFTGVLPELSATPVEGEATAIRGTSVTVLFMAWGGVGQYQPFVGDEVDRMISGATIP